MNYVTEGFEPSKVLKIFEDICAIPHGSGNESGVADYIENLIALTSGQHLQKAHPEGNTQVIDRDFQYLCLICKTESIKNNILGAQGAPVIYSFECFTHVLAVGLRKTVFEDLPENDFEGILNLIEVCY